MCHHSMNQSQPLEKWKWEEENAVWMSHRRKNIVLLHCSKMHCCIKSLFWEIVQLLARSLLLQWLSQLIRLDWALVQLVPANSKYYSVYVFVCSDSSLLLETNMHSLKKELLVVKKSFESCLPLGFCTPTYISSPACAKQSSWLSYYENGWHVHQCGEAECRHFRWSSKC